VIPEVVLAVAGFHTGAAAPQKWDRSASRPLVDRRSAKIPSAIFETLTTSSQFSRTGIFLLRQGGLLTIFPNGNISCCRWTNPDSYSIH
jgi:hypothetical protein